MREFNLDHLRTLLAVVDLGSFSGASSALNLAQPTISLHLKELESRLKVRLVERGRRGVAVTPAGTILVAYARELLGIADKAIDAIRDYRDGAVGVVRIGASAGLIAHHMPAVLQQIAARSPAVRVELTVTTTAMAMERLLGGQLDLALVGSAKRQAGLTFTRWSADPLVAYLPASWLIPRRVTPAWLQGQPLLMNEPGSALHHQTLQWFAGSGFLPRALITLNNGEALKSLVAAGYGAAILPRESATQGISADIQICDISPPMKRHTFLVYKTSRSTPEPLKMVIDVLRACGRSPA
ncbi:LysR family transcriptional regulator [Paraburkholderia sp. GAS32]|uniref:LysR family transcriptional regulator n=1 Tax=Paraburkholderia sp. GAS32 TaxID=3035129 RepID=UPI003D204EEF